MNTLCTTVFRLILAIAFPLVIIAGGIKTAPKIAQLKSLGERRDSLLQQIQQKNEAISILKENQYRFMNDPDFIEYILRLNKRMKDNEYVFIPDPVLAK